MYSYLANATKHACMHAYSYLLHVASMHEPQNNQLAIAIAS